MRRSTPKPSKQPVAVTLDRNLTLLCFNTACNVDFKHFRLLSEALWAFKSLLYSTQTLLTLF